MEDPSQCLSPPAFPGARSTSYREASAIKGEASESKFRGLLQGVKGTVRAVDDFLSGKGSGAVPDESVAESREYLNFREYIGILEGHYTEAHRQCARVVRKEGKVAGALQDFAAATHGVGQFEKDPLRRVLGLVAGRCDQAGHLYHLHAEGVEERVEAPLKELARTMKSVRGVMADRAQALAAVAQARQVSGEGGSFRAELTNKQVGRHVPGPGFQAAPCDPGSRDPRQQHGQDPRG